MQIQNLLDYRFTDNHEWILPRQAFGTVGITDYAQEALNDVIYVDLPKLGTRIQKGERFAEIESVKCVSDMHSPVTCEVVEVNQELMKYPERLNQDPYGSGWVMKARVVQATELDDLRDLIRYKAEVSHEVAHVFYLDQNNRIHYLPAVRAEDGLLLTDAKEFESVVAGSLINIGKLRRLDLADEFEELINSSQLLESQLQRFFELHPEFLLGTEYAELHPQVVLREPNADDLRPDFILKPIAGVSHDANIVELKLPTERIVKPTPRRVGLYANVYEAIMQLRTYARYFSEAENREYVRKLLGFTSYRPRLTLIVGKSIQFDTRGMVAEALAAVEPVNLVTYGDVLQKYKRLIEHF